MAQIPSHQPGTLYTSAQLMRYLTISRSTLYRLIEHGDLPRLMVGGQMRFREQDVEYLLKQQLTWGRPSTRKIVSLHPTSLAQETNA